MGELYTFCDSTSGVCRYVSSQVDGMYVCACICAFSLYVGGQYAFVVVPGGVGNHKKRDTSPPTEMDGSCCSG